MDESDDPTRALDDFVRRVRPGAPSQEPPDLSDLAHKIAPGAAPGAARPRGGRLRSGERWSADDVVDVPLVEVRPPARTDTAPPEVELPSVQSPAAAPVAVELPSVDAPAAPDAEDLAASVADATRSAAAQFEADAARARVEWQPDIDALLQRRAKNPRLLPARQPGCWIGAVREVMASTAEIVAAPGGPAVETYAPHRLLLAWAPQGASEAWPNRWPAQVRLSAVPREAAADVLLAQLPDDALLWVMPQTQDLDWALAAEIVLHHDPALRPFQLEALRAFVAAEREATFARLNADYQQAAAGSAVTRRGA
jgi:hypothetical protein